MTITHDHPAILIDGVPRFATFIDFRNWILTENVDVSQFTNWPFKHGISERMKTRFDAWKYYEDKGANTLMCGFPLWQDAIFNAVIVCEWEGQTNAIDRLKKAFPLLFNNLEP